ncbi:helix-turn-helix transcriptional regulator [Streptomyces camelliae]|uniref:LuxR C-terminal-related transcriptional regulator n=1 Tax=Streptomyces camelliae TaxID=3004093 RepID=A0ABY7P2Y9_9ACTN|nr:LuxR C-terminal-related transcriptional regulator [Streptomyces sp. HUAS 2-6]WBO64884.1 LuxR C-terminal-related transcriptional regulator [Streptomyces sp. HUAS 2-6]
MDQAIETLAEFHLVDQVDGAENLRSLCHGGPWWRTVHPHLAAARMASAESRLRRRLFELNTRRDSLTALASVYTARPQERAGAAETVEVVDALRDVISLIEQASAECEHEMITCQPGGGRPTEELEQAVARDTALLDRGVRMRTLYQHPARRHAPTQAYVERVVSAGAEVRTLTDLLGRMIVFDRRIAFLPHHQRRGGAVVLRSPAAVAFLCGAFDRAWDLAVPFGAPEHAPVAVDDLRQVILRLLSQGLKDEVIARRLGISLRTCRKHIADLFQELDAESRFQAGYLAATRDLLRDTPAS